MLYFRGFGQNVPVSGNERVNLKLLPARNRFELQVAYLGQESFLLSDYLVHLFKELRFMYA